MTTPECARCGGTRRLFELQPGVYACRWQGGCDHRAMQQDARLRHLNAMMAELDREQFPAEQDGGTPLA